MNYIRGCKIHITSANSVSSLCIIKQPGVLLLLPGWDAKASQPSHPLHELFRFSKINLLFPFLHLDIVCVTSIQRRGSKGRSVCVCGNEFPLSLPLVHAYRLGTYFRVLNCICLCLLNVKFSTKCYLPKNSISYSVMNIHYVNFNPH